TAVRRTRSIRSHVLPLLLMGCSVPSLDGESSAEAGDEGAWPDRPWEIVVPGAPGVFNTIEEAGGNLYAGGWVVQTFDIREPIIWEVNPQTGLAQLAWRGAATPSGAYALEFSLGSVAEIV